MAVKPVIDHGQELALNRCRRFGQSVHSTRWLGNAAHNGFEPTPAGADSTMVASAIGRFLTCLMPHAAIVT
jgi:hypothetical protein